MTTKSKYLALYHRCNKKRRVIRRLLKGIKTYSMKPHYSDEHIKSDFESMARQSEEERQMQDDIRLHEQAERMEQWQEYWEQRNY